MEGTCVRTPTSVYPLVTSRSLCHDLLSIDERLLGDDDDDGLSFCGPIHPWLEISTWGMRNNAGHYWRETKHGERICLFNARRKWYIAHNEKFVPHQVHTSLREALDAVYRLYHCQINAI